MLLNQQYPSKYGSNIIRVFFIDIKVFFVFGICEVRLVCNGHTLVDLRKLDTNGIVLLLLLFISK